jgi:PD-(D/E)XK nuclease superfamily
MRLSQAHLKLLSSCPRQFQHIYLDQFAPPTPIDQLARMTAGSQFHLLLQQQDLGLPIAAMLAGDPQLQRWFDQFQQQADAILRLEGEPILWQQSEQVRTIAWGEHVLTVVYDRVLLGPTQGQILDWKTYPQPRQVKWLQQDWQTKLYLYVFSETSGLSPHNLALTYWFFPADPTADGAQSWRIGYSDRQHAAIRAELTALLDRLTAWLAAYEATGESFPQVAVDAELCASCSFAVRCGRTRMPDQSALGFTDDPVTPVAAIAEVPL